MAERKESPTRRRKPSAHFAAESFLLSNHSSEIRSTVSTPPAQNESMSFVALDEVGRGCVAGPVVVCATFWKEGDPSAQFLDWMSGLKDSKKMSPAARTSAIQLGMENQFFRNKPDWELPPPVSTPAGIRGRPKLALPVRNFKWSFDLLSDQLKQNAGLQSVRPRFVLSDVCIGAASAEEVDSLGIVQALGLAASRALASANPVRPPSLILFDGNRPLALADRWAQTPQILVTKGDELLKTISASSVIAKVIRDRWMESYSKIFKCYFLDENRGYGTEKHLESVKKHGLTALHRRTFLKNFCPQSSH